MKEDYIKEIVDSCIGIGACRSTANGGNIGYINHGCQGLEACQHAAFIVVLVESLMRAIMIGHATGWHMV